MSARRGWAPVGLSLLLVLALGFGAAAFWIDADRVASAARDRIAARLGWELSFEGADASWLPSPSVRLRQVRLRANPGETPFLTAERIDLRLSLLALLRGRMELRSLDVVSPILTLDGDSDAGTALPAPIVRRSASRSADDLGLHGARLLFRNGVVEIGSLRFVDVEARGRAGGDRSLGLELTAELPGAASLRDGRVTLSEGDDGSVAWSAAVSVVNLDLEALEALRASKLDARKGVGQGTLALTGTDRSLVSAELFLSWRDLDLRGTAGLGVRGDAQLEARLGGSWSLDLGAAEVDLGGSLRKPAGVPTRAAGPAPAALPRSVADWELHVTDLQLGRSRLRGEVRMISGRPSGEVSGEVDLADLAAWSGWSAVRGGRVALERLAYAPPLPLHGSGHAERVELELGERPWTLSLSGPVSLLGEELTTRRAVVGVLDESFHVAGSYDLASRQWELDVAARSGVELAALAEAVETGPFRTGRTYGRASLRGGRQLADLAGGGEFEIFDGTAHHLSLARVGPTGIAPGSGPFAFQRLSGLFEIRDRTLALSELVLEQDGETASVSGSVSLADGRVELAGGAEYVIEGEAVRTPIQLSGTLDRLDAQVEDPPEVRAERREGALQMLEAMRIQARESPVPEEPERARALREHLERIEEQLRRIQDGEADA